MGSNDGKTKRKDEGKTKEKRKLDEKYEKTEGEEKLESGKDQKKCITCGTFSVVVVVVVDC